MSNEYDDILNAIYDKVDAAILASGQNNKDEFVKRLKTGVENLVIYSAYEVSENGVGLPIDNLDEIPFEGTFVVIADYDEFWDGRSGFIGHSMNPYDEVQRGRAYKSDPITDPTWLQLTVLANESIITTNDTHHVYFEGVSKGKGILNMFFGS